MCLHVCLGTADWNGHVSHYIALFLATETDALFMQINMTQKEGLGLYMPSYCVEIYRYTATDTVYIGMDKECHRNWPTCSLEHSWRLSGLVSQIIE